MYEETEFGIEHLSQKNEVGGNDQINIKLNLELAPFNSSFVLQLALAVNLDSCIDAVAFLFPLLRPTVLR